MNYLDNKEFMELINPIINHPNYIKQKKFIQHKNCTVYDHCINVAFLCYLKAKRSEKKVDMNSLIRGALLHDYFLYDWHLPHGILHGYKHPIKAVINAKRDFNINLKEANIIRSHMFPLTILHFPKSKEAWWVCFYDKVSAHREMKKNNKPINY